MPNNVNGPRPRIECLAHLDAELAWFRAQIPVTQHSIDAKRAIPTEQTHALLAYYLEHGRFADEPNNRWSVKRTAQSIAA